MTRRKTWRPRPLVRPYERFSTAYSPMGRSGPESNPNFPARHWQSEASLRHLLLPQNLQMPLPLQRRQLNIRHHPHRHIVQREFPTHPNLPRLRRQIRLTQITARLIQRKPSSVPPFVCVNLTSTCPRSSISRKSFMVFSGRRLTSTACDPSESRLTKSFTTVPPCRSGSIHSHPARPQQIPISTEPTAAARAPPPPYI